jgi:putative phosphoesterase
MDIEFNQIIDIEDARIFMTHGHYFSSFTEYVSNKKLVAFGKEHNVDLILHGHTHVKKDDVLDGIRILNPGSLSDPRDGVKGSYITFEVDGNEINNVEFHFIN